MQSVCPVGSTQSALHVLHIVFPQFDESAHTNLGLWVNETDAVLVDGNQENLRKDWLRGLLENVGTKQRRAEASEGVADEASQSLCCYKCVCTLRRQWWRLHLDFKEGRSEGRPLVDDLQEHEFGFLPGLA